MDHQPFDFFTTIGEMRTLVGASSLAVLGGVVRALRSPHCTAKQLVIEFFTSLFAGIIIWLVIRDLPFGEYYRAGIVGVCGYIAPKMLDYFSVKACAYIGVDGGKT